MKKLIYVITSVAIIAACNPTNMMDNKSTANETKFRRFYDEVINAHNPNMVDSFCSADFVDHAPSPGHSGKGLDDLKAQFKEFFAMYPDVHMTPSFVVAKGDTMCALVTMTGTNQGPMGPNMPATGKSFNVMATDIVIIKDGKATERWGYGEEMKMMQQLGMMGGGGGADSSHMAMEKK